MPTTELTPADWDVLTGEGGAYTIAVPSRAPNPAKGTPDNALVLDVSTALSIIGQLTMRVKAARMADLPDANYEVRGWADFQVTPASSACSFGLAARANIPGIEAATEFAGILLAGGFLMMGGPPTFAFILLDMSTLSGSPRLIGDPVFPATPAAPFRMGLRLKVVDGDAGPRITAAYNIEGAEWIDILTDFEDVGTSSLLSTVNGAVVLGGDDLQTAGDTLILDDLEIEEVIIPPPLPPVISRVEPLEGNTQGGSHVTIHGENFVNVQSVLFYDPLVPTLPPVEAQWVVDSATEISVIAPPNYPGFMDIRVTTETGEAIYQDFEYTDLGTPDIPLENFEDESWALPDPDTFFPLSVPYDDDEQMRRVTEAAAYPFAAFPDARPGTLDSACGLVALERAGRLKLAVALTGGETVIETNEPVNNILEGSAVQIGEETISIQSVNLGTNEITLQDPVAGAYPINEPVVVTHRTGAGIPHTKVYTETVSDPGATTISGTLSNVPMSERIEVVGDVIGGTSDLDGNISGTGITSGTINYVTGAYSITFSAPLTDDVLITYSAHKAYYGQASYYSPQVAEGRMTVRFKVDAVTGVFAEAPAISGGFEILSRFFSQHSVPQAFPIDSHVAFAAFVRNSGSAIVEFAPEDLRLELYQMVAQQKDSDLVPLISMTVPGAFETSGIGQWIALRLTVEEASPTSLRYIGEYDIGAGWVEAFDQTLTTNAAFFIGKDSRWGWRVNATKSTFAGDTTYDNVTASVSAGHRVVARVDDWELEKF